VELHRTTSKAIDSKRTSYFFPAPKTFCPSTNMNSTELRDAFRTFAGEDAYKKFVRTFNLAPDDFDRLRFWQDTLWSKFSSTHPNFPTESQSIRDAFRVCELHDETLLLDSVLAPYSQLRPRITESPDTGLHHGISCVDCPYPGWGMSPEDWPPEENKMVDVLYCPTCRDNRKHREELHNNG